jgi:threonine aldolase
MYSFTNDYSEICHPNILRRLLLENDNQFSGYSEDQISDDAKTKIKGLLKDNNVDIHFLTGGTQTNLITILNCLNVHQGVISANTGHIATHESGAIEATGHKVLTIDSADGKLYPKEVEQMMVDFENNETFEHVVEPGMIYISLPTEVGTIYSKKELKELHKLAKKYKIPFFIDGARLASALTSKENDIRFNEMTKLCDMFYIGGTKCGAMIGECLVIVNDSYKKHFRPLMKQRGALLAKGFVLAIQFDELFKDDLYFTIGHHENDLADKINESLLKGGIQMFQNQVTNQIFPILKNDKIKELKKNYNFHIWEKIDESNSVIRLCISYATNENVVNNLIKDILK